MSNQGSSTEQGARVTPGANASGDLPIRKGPRPATLRGPLHIQCNGHGDQRYLHQLVADVLSWPHIERNRTQDSSSRTVPIRLEETATANESAAFISPREFARALLGAPTIYLALPLVSAHWAIVRGWAEPHYLCSFGLMPAGAVVLYTPQAREELSVCYSLFFTAYDLACKSSSGTESRFTVMASRETGDRREGLRPASSLGGATNHPSRQ